MGTSTILLSFELDKDEFDSEEAHKLYQNIPQLCFGDQAAELQTVCECGTRGDKLVTASAADGSHVVIHLYHFGFLTVDLQLYVEELKYLKPMAKPYNLVFIKELEKKIKQHLGNITTKSYSIYSPIKRAPAITWPYGALADERLVEFDYEELLCEVQSEWQNIKIYKSKEFGNALHLDDDIMLGESDYIYTSTLLGLGHNDFNNKSCLILGGGDGGVLHELLKENPKYVTMVEIDEEVIKACRTHMRSVCGEDLDTYQTKNKHVKIDDCVKVLKDATEKSEQFDYVINDLTEYSVDKDQYGFDYDFKTTNLIFELALKCLADDGKYLARGNCLSAYTYVQKVEEEIRDLHCHFKRTDVHVPSFKETYTLYEVWKK